ncbi:hypothetical protein GCM10028895_26350 [Pontibacter rugosus]
MLVLLSCGAVDQGYRWGGPLLRFLGAGCPPGDMAALYVLFGLFGIVYGTQLLVDLELDQIRQSIDKEVEPW